MIELILTDSSLEDELGLPIVVEGMAKVIYMLLGALLSARKAEIDEWDLILTDMRKIVVPCDARRRMEEEARSSIKTIETEHGRVMDDVSKFSLERFLRLSSFSKIGTARL